MWDAWLPEGCVDIGVSAGVSRGAPEISMCCQASVQRIPRDREMVEITSSQSALGCGQKSMHFLST